LLARPANGISLQLVGSLGLNAQTGAISACLRFFISIVRVFPETERGGENPLLPATFPKVCWAPAGRASSTATLMIRCGILLSMLVTLAHIGSASPAKDGCDALVRDYLKRCAGWARSSTEAFRSEKALLEWLHRQRGRTETVATFLDGRGRQMSSEELASWLGLRRDEGSQHLVFAVGPADGWSDEARAEAARRGGLLSLGKMTLAHSLARLVMAEQIYRAVTILTGHPYHRG
jgi:23S rRNA (pseudouridine1915-N3)-methyltransferase